jgi:hypothetical protein
MSVTLDAADPAAFARSVDILQRYKQRAPRLRSQNFGAAIAVLLYRDPPAPPRVGPPRLLSRPNSGAVLTTGELQVDVCDPTWEKDRDFLPVGAEGPIHKPFTASFKGRSPGVNNWRNSFDLQAGLGCDAPYTGSYLLAPGYLAEPRFDCPFRDHTTGRCESPRGHSGADRTCFNPNKRDVPPGPETNATNTPKLLTRGQDSDGAWGYWYVEPTVEVLADVVGDPGNRVPAFPFAAALYCGSSYLSAWGADASPERLEADLALGPQEFATLFDLDPASAYNVAMVGGRGGTDGASGVRTRGWGADVPTSAGTTRGSAGLSAPVPYKERGSGEFDERAGREPDPARRRRLQERANQGHKRALKALVGHLEASGYEVNEQLDGFDLRGSRETEIDHLFEVKTWTLANLGNQVRSGWAQLIEYRYRNRNILAREVQLYLVLDRKPPTDYWAWSWLADDLDVTPCWVKEGRLETFDEYRDRLPPA